MFALTPHLGKWAYQDFDRQVIQWPYYLFYVQNLVYDRLGSFALVITWSLCVEEQFYLIWPFLARLCSRRTMTAIALAVLLLGTPFRMYLHHIGASMGFFFTFARLDPIAAGALVALQPKWFKYTWVAAPWAFYLLKVGEFEFVYFALALTFGSIVMHVVSRENKFLQWTPLRFVGKISYGVYIYHPVMFGLFWLTPLYSMVEGWRYAEQFRLLGQILFPIPFAALSWYVFEQPILRLKKYFESDAPEKRKAPAVRALAAEAGD